MRVTLTAADIKGIVDFYVLSDIKQKKTGVKVAIPSSSQMLEITDKYDYFD